MKLSIKPSMKIKHLFPLLAIIAMGVTFSAQAHDPKQHMKNAEKPNCKTMENMDHSKMDMSDPVMQAMMKQCMNDKGHDKTSDPDHQAQEKALDDQHSGHQH
jgi:hypothetical protein